MLTESDLELLETLAKRVPAMVFSQVAELYGDAGEAKRGLARLKRAGLIESAVFTVRLLHVHEPVFRLPDDGVPRSFYPIERKLRGRWKEPARSERVYSVGELRRPLHVDHELAVASVYLALRSRGAWLGERQIYPRRGAGVRVPDGVLIDAAGNRTAIDFASSYSCAKVREIVEYYQTNPAYAALELW
jgi:hypothetical protein